MFELRKRGKEDGRELYEIADLLSDELTERRAQRDQRRLAKLKELLAAEKMIIEQCAGTMPALETAAAIARADELRIESELQSARQRRICAELERMGASLEFTSRFDSIKAGIRKLAPPVINDFIHKMVDELQTTRLQIDTRERLGEANFLTGRRKVHFISNKKSVEDRLSAIRQVIVDAELMKTSTLSEGKIAERLEALPSSLPEIRDEHLTFDSTKASVLQ